jgi:transglutaminase-like putative cysteine protease
MTGWRNQLKPALPLERQADLWKWVHDNVDYRVRSANLF